MLAGTAFGMGAGVMWGTIFLVPLLLPDYPALVLSAGRYLAFGLVVLVPAWLGRAHLLRLGRADWLRALELSLIGNMLYYLGIALAVQRAGAPMTTMIIGTLPVVISVVGNRGAHRIAWRRLALPLVVIGLGLGLVHHDEWGRAGAGAGEDYALGLLAALGALICWTWYPLRNAAWIKARPSLSMSGWATAQGLATLPLALAAFLVVDGMPGFDWPFGPDPWLFVGLMLVLGICASWLGTWFWNQTSRLLPAGVSGQMIVFETVFGMAYTFLYRGQWPESGTMAGLVLLVGGVVLGVRAARA
ncbi:hypothetical protein A6A04_18375 [Paramagnetospirillum marisnigri]|uniref:EamA domain-containing protein n=1 Tax=Paramagnetospirillum marisnigri TaxID=1285242 RepID=A0A178MP92_9PROT|nr:hypothetical protein A6A04_18375 [Paramagnetospirillum marisnigri]